MAWFKVAYTFFWVFEISETINQAHMFINIGIYRPPTIKTVC